jgi:hypothetical protein
MNIYSLEELWGGWDCDRACLQTTTRAEPKLKGTASIFKSGGQILATAVTYLRSDGGYRIPIRM